MTPSFDNLPDGPLAPNRFVPADRSLALRLASDQAPLRLGGLYIAKAAIYEVSGEAWQVVSYNLCGGQHDTPYGHKVTVSLGTSESIAYETAWIGAGEEPSCERLNRAFQDDGLYVRMVAVEGGRALMIGERDEARPKELANVLWSVPMRALAEHDSLRAVADARTTQMRAELEHIRATLAATRAELAAARAALAPLEAAHTELVANAMADAAAAAHAADAMRVACFEPDQADAEFAEQIASQLYN